MYFYRCQARRVIDGDTLELDIDLGCRVHTRQIVRLLAVNAPEIRGVTAEAGEQAKRRLLELLRGAGEFLCCRTHLDRKDKYGRLLVNLYASEQTETTLNEVLVREGLAAAYVP